MNGARRETVQCMRQAESPLVVSCASQVSRRVAVRMQSLPKALGCTALSSEAGAYQRDYRSVSQEESEESRRLQAPLLRGTQEGIRARSAALAQEELGVSLHQSPVASPVESPGCSKRGLHARRVAGDHGRVRLHVRVLPQHVEVDGGSHCPALEGRRAYPGEYRPRVSALQFAQKQLLISSDHPWIDKGVRVFAGGKAKE